MKYAEINRKYTEKVAEFLAQGYTINTMTMSGTQGEIAHIDLTDGKRIVRVLIESYNDWGDTWNNGIRIMAGVAEESVEANSDKGYLTIWNNRLTELYSVIFYEVGTTRTGEKFYGTKEEAEAAREKHYARVKDRKKKDEPTDITGKALEIGVKAVRSHYGIKRPNKSNVRVVRQSSRSDYQYYVYYGNKHFALS